MGKCVYAHTHPLTEYYVPICVCKYIPTEQIYYIIFMDIYVGTVYPE